MNSCLDATHLLASHRHLPSQKGVTEAGIKQDYRVICTTQQNAKLTSNEFLFGVDLSKRADEALKAKRLAYKLAGSNVAKNGNSRGCGYQNRTYMQYQSKRSGFQQYQNQWQYAYQNRYNGGKRYANGQTGAPAPKYKKQPPLRYTSPPLLII